MIAYPVYRHVLLAVTVSHIAIPHDCYHLRRSRFVRYLPELFVPPAEDAHAKRSEGRVVWEYVLENLMRDW
jgi:hypothetical protein